MTVPRRPRPQVLSISNAAALRLNAIMATKGEGIVGMRLGIKKGGCAGMEYTMDWADKVGPADEVVEKDGARVIVDPKAVLFLLGTVMDFQVDTLSARFVFTNPNQQSACGCGESVNLVPAPKDRLEA